MVLHQNLTSRDGYPENILFTPGPVIEIRISSTQPVSPCTPKWISADKIEWPEYDPEPEESREYKWSFFPEWHSRAKCRDVEKPDEVFFGESEEESRTTMTVSRLRHIKAFCLSCPVWETCLRHALTQPERHGLWGGTSKRTRLRILALLDSGEVTVDQVIDDYKEGREKKYESIRNKG